MFKLIWVKSMENQMNFSTDEHFKMTFMLELILFAFQYKIKWQKIEIKKNPKMKIERVDNINVSTISERKNIIKWKWKYKKKHFSLVYLKILKIVSIILNDRRRRWCYRLSCSFETIHLNQMLFKRGKKCKFLFIYLFFFFLFTKWKWSKALMSQKHSLRQLRILQKTQFCIRLSLKNALF